MEKIVSFAPGARRRRRIAALVALLLALLACMPGALAEADFQDVGGGVLQFTETDGDSAVFAEEPESTQPPAAQDDEAVIPSATLSPKVAELPWNLILVNRNNPVPDDWEVDLVTLSNGRKVDRRILPDLQRMFDDCRRAGLKPTVYTAYRTYDDQKQMLLNKYRQFRKRGYSHQQAQIEALKLASYPGYSEHQLGLAVDIDSANTEVCSNSAVWNWMKRHCQEYGFIWRYPAQKSDITGISNEDWHFRYVGVEAATYIMTNHLSLEEYLQEVYDIPY